MKNTTLKSILTLLIVAISFVAYSTNKVNTGNSGKAGEATDLRITMSILSVSAGVTTEVSCNAGSNGVATAVATGGVSPYTYLWSDGSAQTNAVATGLSAGTYTVTVTDNITSVETAIVTIIQPAVITPSVRISNPLCYAGTGTATMSVLGGTVPYTYSWSGGQTTSIVTGLSVAGGTYTVTVSDKNLCSNTLAVTLTQPTLLAITMASNTNVSSHGGKGSATANTATGGTSPYLYSWNSGGTNLTTTNIYAGTYVITTTDSHGCTATVSTTITQPTALAMTIASRTGVDCNGNSTGSITANTPSGGTSPYTYSWAPSGGTNLTASDLSAGIYSITATDNNGCTIVASGTVTQPTALSITILSHVNVNCNGGSTGSITANTPAGGASPYTYSWAASGGNALSAPNLSAGTYTITALDNHGCSASATATITQPAASLAITMASHTNISCYGGTGSATANTPTGGTSPFRYTWSPSGGTNITASSLYIGTYTVTTTDIHGCTATTTTTITQPVALAITIASRTSVSCNGGTGSITANTATGGTTAYTYSWAPSGGTNLTASSLTPGTFTITATDNHGCTAVANATITQPYLLVVTKTTQTNVTCNGTSTGSATVSTTGGTMPYAYGWAPSGGASATANDLSAGTYTITATDGHGCTATTTATITQPVALAITIASHTNASCNGHIGSVTANTPTGGTTPYAYSWSPNGGIGITASSLYAGTYTVKVTDAHACTATATATVTQPSTLAITMASHTGVTCNGGSTGSATANTPTGGSSPYTYSWAPSGGNALTASDLSAGAYTITTTDNKGCIAVVAATISQPNTLSITMQTPVNVSCHGGTGSATANTPIGGTTPYAYSWSPSGGAGLAASGLTAGTYTVTTTDANGCTADASATITEPFAALSVSIASQMNPRCYEGTGSISAFPTTGGTTPYVYSWTPSGGNNYTASGLSAGTYTILVTDGHRCTAQRSATLTQPAKLSISIASKTNVSCNGGNTGSITANTPTGGTPIYLYYWAPSGGYSYAASSLSAGMYTVTTTDGNGCTAVATTTITQPLALSINLENHVNVSCYGGTGSATAFPANGGTSPYAYSWSPSGGNSTAALGLSASTYTVTVTDGLSCTAANSVTITQPAATLTSTLSSSADPICYAGRGSASIGVTGGTTPYIYTWTPYVTAAASSTNLLSGNYSVTVKDNHGCTATPITFSLTQPLAIRDSTVSYGCNTSGGTALIGVKYGTSPYTYAWSPGGGTNATMTSLANGTYTVIVTDNEGCTARVIQSISCEIVPSEEHAGPNITTCLTCMGNINLYPNPSSGTFFINGLDKGMMIELYDYTGRMVSTTIVSSETMQLSLSNQANGIYLIRILDNSGALVSQKKVVKAQ